MERVLPFALRHPTRPEHPGVYIGSWRIEFAYKLPNSVGARHLALALLDWQRLPRVVELVGWPDSKTNRISERRRPYYGEFADYKWQMLAPVTAVERTAFAIKVARQEFEGRLYYPADSNRFVGDVLGHARIRLTPLQQHSLGLAPGFGSYHWGT